MKRSIVVAASIALVAATALGQRPHQASADPNGICIPYEGDAPDTPVGAPLSPACTPERRMYVLSEPDPEGSPFPVTVVSMPSSSSGGSGSVTVTNFPTPVSNQNVTVSNFPAAQTYPTPIPFPSLQPVSVTNWQAYPTPIPFPSVQPVSIATTLPAVLPPANYTNLLSSGTTVIRNAPTTFLGMEDVSTSVQVTAITCYDNATAASGTVVLNTVLGLTNPSFPDGGVAMKNGLTCNVPVSLLGNGIAIYWRKT